MSGESIIESVRREFRLAELKKQNNMYYVYWADVKDCHPYMKDIYSLLINQTKSFLPIDFNPILLQKNLYKLMKNIDTSISNFDACLVRSFENLKILKDNLNYGISGELKEIWWDAEEKARVYLADLEKCHAEFRRLQEKFDDTADTYLQLSMQ